MEDMSVRAPYDTIELAHNLRSARDKNFMANTGRVLT